MGRGEIPGAQRSAPFRSMLRATDLPSNLNLPPSPYADPTRSTTTLRKAGQKKMDHGEAHDNPARGAHEGGDVTTPENDMKAHPIMATRATHLRRRDVWSRGNATSRSGTGTPPTLWKDASDTHPPYITRRPTAGGRTRNTVPTSKEPTGGDWRFHAHEATHLPRGCNRRQRPPR